MRAEAKLMGEPAHEPKNHREMMLSEACRVFDEIENDAPLCLPGDNVLAAILVHYARLLGARPYPNDVPGATGEVIKLD